MCVCCTNIYHIYRHIASFSIFQEQPQSFLDMQDFPPSDGLLPGKGSRSSQAAFSTQTGVPASRYLSCPRKRREPSVFPKTPSLFSFLLSGAGPALIHPPAYLAIRTLLPISSSSFFPGSSTMPPNGICAMSFQSSGTSNSFRTASLITGL